MKISIGIIFIMLIVSVAFADEGVGLEKIVVTAHEGAGSESLKKNYPVQVISAAELSHNNLGSIGDLLKYVCGMDVRTRGPSGMQSDLSLRGSTFEEVSVLIDGVKVMDPQTGHYNLDIPLTQFDIERVEVLKSGASSFYGAGAFAGSVNIITKRPGGRLLQAQTLFGEHALFGQSMSLSLPQDIFSSRLSFDHAVSKAARPNTDFEYGTAALFLEKQFPAFRADSVVGYQKKDFGADSFYSNLFPEEEEHTQTFFWKTGVVSPCEPGELKSAVFLRKHSDKFILERNKPAAANYHTTYVYGVNSEYSLPLEYGTFIAGLEAGSDEISSSSLGKHSRLREAASLGFIPDLGERFSFDSRVRLDYYREWHAQGSYNLGAAYDLIEERLQIKGALSRSFRIPSFTELYYSDAANKGNPDLKVQTADSLSAGLGWKVKNAEIGAGAFVRKGRNLIDWTRTAAADPWRATNLGKVDFSGVEFNSKITPGLNAKGLGLNTVIFSYAYTRADKKASGFYSKYALDILKNRYALALYSSVCGFSLDWQLSYNERNFGETYFVGGVSLSRRIIRRGYAFEPFVRIENITNAKYSEVGGVVQPGRWVKSGLKFQW